MALELPLASIRGICARYGVTELCLFGSAARDDFSPESDVDLLVTFRPDATVTFFTLSRMAAQLSAAIGRPVDLVPKTDLKPLVREEILATTRVLYAA